MNKLKKLAIAISLLMVSAFAQNSSTQQMAGVGSWGEGDYYAPSYNYQTSVFSGGSTAGGTYTITLFKPFVTLPGGRNVAIFSSATAMPPITIGQGAAKETVTPSSSSGCNAFNAGVGSATCTVTATFTNAHGQGDVIISGSAGLQEAINDAQSHGGGNVVVDSIWTANGGTTALLAAAIPYQNVTVQDKRGVQQWWSVGQGAATALATPTALTAQAACDATHTFCSDASVAGTWTSGTLYGCVAYVDIMGNEGTCSTTANFTTVVSKAIDVAAPAASTGAVGYTIYLSLIGGSYAFAYKVPITSSICTLTTVETTTAACAVTNATYGTTGSNAVIAAVTVNTAMLAPLASTISSTTDYVPNPNARTSYIYVASNRVGLPGVVTASLPFPAGAAAGSTVPDVIGTLTLPAGFMNQVGKTIEICGYATEASAGSTATISDIQLWWDAPGSNAAGVPVLISTVPMTNTLVTAKTDQFGFCRTLKTTVSGASATAGSIQQTSGWYQNQYTSASVATVPLTVLAQGPAAVGSLNLAGEARIEVVWLHTTGTDGAGVVLQDLTVKVLN